MTDDERTQAELDIRNLTCRLAHLADGDDLDEYVAQFTDDAVWDYARFGPRHGRDEIHAGAHQRRVDGVQGPGSGIHHIITTQWVRVDDHDHAVSQAYWMTLKAVSPPVVDNTGRYDDELRRTPDGWKVARRTITTEVN